MKKLTFVLLPIIAIFSLSFTLNKSSDNLNFDTGVDSAVVSSVQVNDDIPFDQAEEYNQGYKDGYCDGFKEGMCDPYFNCPGVPYVDNQAWFNGCNNSSNPWKCGYRAGLKHGYKDARKYSDC